MNHDSRELLIEADTELFKGRAVRAMELYIQAAFSLLYNANDESDPKEAMDKAIHCYRKINPDYFPDPSQDFIQQYFSAVRSWYDNRLSDDQKAVEEEIYRFIPIEAADDGREELPQGEVQSLTINVDPYQVGIAMGQGIREEMEDAHAATSFKLEDLQFHLFCVFDGHGGKTCAQYIAHELPETLKKELETVPSFTMQSIYKAIVAACVKVDQKWKTLPFQQENLADRSGSTATIALLIDQKDLWIANVGDSGAAIDQNGIALQLSESAKPTIPHYYKEIFIRGGFVSNGRVDGTLDMARSIGDLFHPSVSPRPTIKRHSISKDNHYLIIACDGLWDVIDAQTALDSITGREPQDAAEHLRMLAYQRGSTDNTTILVIRLHQ